MTTIAPEPDIAESARTPAGRSGLRRILELELTPRKVKQKDLMHFSRQLAVFARAGIPLLDALDSITSEITNKFFREILLDVRTQLVAGRTLSDAVGAHAEAFPEFYIGMLQAAELTGHLDSVLDQLAQYIERDLDARQKVTSALVYPTVVMGLAGVTVAVLTLYVLPKFKTLFHSLHAKLPLPTRILLDIADWVGTYWYVVVAIPVVIILALWATVSTERGRELRDKVLLRLPAFGIIVQYSLLERFCRILGSMSEAGVALAEALHVAIGSTNNRLFQQRLKVAREAMLRGEGLAGPMARTELFPAAARQMMAVGERTGSMDQQLETAASYFGRELDYKIKRFTSLFEPAVLLAVGVVVGFVAVALVSAMYGIYHQVKV
ncbi:MAG: type II secretion system F family protein [Frankiaceae bacterium]|nr:type II secretion system F family protein [Frankiaceae bacterium]MBV9368256.1 type II secretion system F family protein [Frankiales bacterium]